MWEPVRWLLIDYKVFVKKRVVPLLPVALLRGPRLPDVNIYWQEELRLLHLYFDEEGCHDPMAVLQGRWYLHSKRRLCCNGSVKLGILKLEKEDDDNGRGFPSPTWSAWHLDHCWAMTRRPITPPFPGQTRYSVATLICCPSIHLRLGHCNDTW